jgi:ELWxxDGT repeat protein
LHTATTTSANLVKDLVVGYPHGWAEEITSMGSYILFSGDKELYRSDGTTGGTTLVKDINAGGNTGSSPGQSYPRHFIRVAANLMAFSGDDARNGRELWVSDGTSSGTRMLADINPGQGSSAPQDFVLIGATLFFSADDGTHGRELWKVVFGQPNGPPPAVTCPPQQVRVSNGVVSNVCFISHTNDDDIIRVLD